MTDDTMIDQGSHTVVAHKATEALAIIADLLGRDDLAEPLCCGWATPAGAAAADEVVRLVREMVSCGPASLADLNRRVAALESARE